MAILWTLTVVAAALTGFWLGQTRGYANTNEVLQAEVAGTLTRRLLELSLLRLGESAQAIAMMEEHVDTAVVTMAANPGPHRGALIGAKAYRIAVPPVPARAVELERVFSTLPTPTLAQCATPLQRLIEKSPGAATVK